MKSVKPACFQISFFRLLLLAFSIVCLSVPHTYSQDLENDGVTVQDELIRINKRKQLARQFFEIGNHPQAIHYSKQYFEFNPKHWKSALVIAESSYHMRDYEAAIEWFEKYIEIAPAVYPRSIFYLALSHKSLGNYEEAVYLCLQ